MAITTDRTACADTAATKTRRYVVLLRCEAGLAAGTPILSKILDACSLITPWIIDSPLELKSVNLLHCFLWYKMSNLFLNQVPFRLCPIPRSVEKQLCLEAPRIKDSQFCRWGRSIASYAVNTNPELVMRKVCNIEKGILTYLL